MRVFGLNSKEELLLAEKTQRWRLWRWREPGYFKPKGKQVKRSYDNQEQAQSTYR